jgi:subtilisin family serine protease
MAAAHASVRSKIHTAAMQDSGDEEGVTLIGTSLDVSEAVQLMNASGTVEYAEENYIYTHQATSNDPYVTTTIVDNQLWGMYSPTATGGGKANRYGIGATTAWQNGKTDCSTVYIGIIDEGYQHTHADLTVNAGKNTGEIPDNGKDDDGNGYIDDVYGWDFVSNNKSVYDGTADDHGTHVAGTIGAVGGHGVGVAGVCWKVKLLNAKFLGSSGGTTANAIKAIDYFTNLKTRTVNRINIVATNNSWGGGGYSQALKDAIARANNAGILFVAAADNSGASSANYPAGYDNTNIISVASINKNGTLSAFSNYGSTSVDIGAPGEAIWSTVPGGYAKWSGTSMATPHVSGAVALYKARNSGATAAQIKAAILKAGTATSSLNGKVLTGDRLNVAGF